MLWKIELGRAVMAGEAMQDRATRDECRIKCGANPIVGLSFLLSPDRVVVRDCSHVIICGLVTVVPPRTFEGYENLERVEIQEGVEDIRAAAFLGCDKLERVDCPSSIRTIHIKAFAWCRLR